MNAVNRINLESLPPYYQVACTLLQQSILNSQSDEEKVQHCEMFLEKYFMIPTLWYDFLDLLKETDAPKDVIEGYSNQALSQFYAENLYPCLVLDSKPFTKIIGAPHYLSGKTKYMTKEHLEDGLLFPHEHLDTLFHHYIQLTGNPVPPNLYKAYLKSKKTYDHLCRVYEKEETWIRALTNSWDEDFVKQNIEARIAREFVNKKLWRAYISYLESRNDMWVLSVYCRYCNFFIEDLGMREKYLAKIEYFANREEPVSKWWIDVITFAFNHGSPEEIKEIILKALSGASVDFSPLNMFLEFDLEDFLPKKLFEELRTEVHRTYDRVVGIRNKKWSDYFPTNFLCEKTFVYMGRKDELPAFDRELFGFNRILRNNRNRHGTTYTTVTVDEFEPLPQSFSIPKPILRYIMDTAPFHIWFKLYQTCKYFFQQQQLVPVYSLSICNFDPPKSLSNQLSVFCSPDHATFQALSNLWIKGFFSSCNAIATRETLLKSLKFEPRIIHLQTQTIPLETFKQLMESNSCKVLKLGATFATHPDGTNASLDEILEASPSVTDYSFRCHSMTTNNHRLSTLTRENKIQRLTLKFVNDELEVPSFLQFLKKNSAPLCQVKIFFDHNATPQYRTQMKTALRDFQSEMPEYCGKKWIMCKIKSLPF